MQHSLFVSSSTSVAPRRGGAALVSCVAHAAGIAALVGAPFLSDAELPPVPSPPPPPVSVVRLPAGGGGGRPAPPTTPMRPRPAAPTIPLPSEVVPLAPGDEVAELPACPECTIGGAGVPGDASGGEGFGTGPGPVGPGTEPEPAVAPVRVSSLTPPRRLVYVEPQYPEAARRTRIDGFVILECVIDARGRVVDVQVLRGRPLLDEAAVAAVRQWIYAPTLLGGVPVPVVMTVTVRFEVS
ncbi:MAG: energy transducer TonB [Vicinamibacteria bacterium]|nr:energy transducer TonB [Vicinamibacteria bacterium]